MMNGAECAYALYESQGRSIQYVLVLDTGQADIEKFDLGNRQRILYQNLQELGDRLEPEFDKNVSLLLCAEGSIGNEKLEKEVLKLEENPYCFKKLVLTYTQKELENLVESTEKENLWDFMNQKLEILKRKKENFDKEAEFILRLLIKMPFLAVNVEEEQIKKNLVEEIEKGLGGADKIIWEDIKSLESAEIEEIKNYKEEKLDDFLKKWCGEEKR